MLHEQLDGQLRLVQLDPLQGQTFSVRKRDGRIVPFDETRIHLAIEAAFKADAGLRHDQPLPPAAQNNVIRVTNAVTHAAITRAVKGDTLEIEFLQDLVETQLMEAGHHSIVRRYILYREERRKARALRGDRTMDGVPQAQLFVSLPDNSRESLDPQRIRRRLISACRGIEDNCSASGLADETLKNLYDGVKTEEIEQAMIFAARSWIEHEPDYTFVAARLLLRKLYREALSEFSTSAELAVQHRDHYPSYIARGVEVGRLSPELLNFDLNRLAAAMRLDRDQQFTYMGVQTLYDRYLVHHEGRRLETPQYFWMRVAMGLAINEGEQKSERAIEFYDVLSAFRFISSTPTLFNSGTAHPQLSSCYLSTVMDDLEHIFKVVSDDAKLSKWAGGLGNDWTNIRATGAHINGTNGTSQGVIPFLKVANDTAVAVNQGGKRKGAMCAYLETWHLDIEDFLELRKNTGDERRRTHDMNTANWIPDMFMKRVMEKGEWTLFSPSDTPDLHDKVGKAFEQAYVGYEAKAAAGEIRVFKKIQALDLWRKMLSMLFETGHPWITFKDPCNIRSPQSHVGVVHSSNLCTEITLNTGPDEIAVCNLGSVNMPAHMKEGKLDHVKLAKTVRTAMRMLDNVIDINYYAVDKARNSNMRHRPVGMGVMGFQDCLHMMRIPFASDAAVSFADTSMEAVCYYAYLASTELAEERGRYESYAGSLWDRGILPQDSVKLLAEERGGYLEVDSSSAMDWTPVRERIAKFGMRNSNCVAIAPTATISNIIGVSACIEPTFQNLYVKSNLSGEFTEINGYLVRDLKARDLWDEVMISDLKYFDGSLVKIDRIPQDLRDIYATAFEVSPSWLVEAASRRQKWIDQAQSLNIYMAGASGKKLDETYKLAWLRGLKTTYYLRTIAATHMEKSTSKTGALNAVAVDGGMSASAQSAQAAVVAAAAVAVAPVVAAAADDADGEACYLRPGDDGFEECEACQ